MRLRYIFEVKAEPGNIELELVEPKKGDLALLSFIAATIFVAIAEDNELSTSCRAAAHHYAATLAALVRQQMEA